MQISSTVTLIWTRKVAGFVSDRLSPRSPFDVVEAPAGQGHGEPARGLLTEPAIGSLLHVVAAGRRPSAGLGGPPSGRAIRGPDGSLVTSPAPGEVLVFVPPGQVTNRHDEWARAADAAGGSVLDISHGTAVLRMTGPAGLDTLAHLCALDISRLQAGTYVRTSVAGVGTAIVIEPGGLSSYLLVVDRSFGRYLQRVLLAAGEEHGLRFDTSDPAG
jgi:sarcosine oxidase, subunit alpha